MRSIITDDPNEAKEDTDDGRNGDDLVKASNGNGNRTPGDTSCSTSGSESFPDITGDTNEPINIVSKSSSRCKHGRPAGPSHHLVSEPHMTVKV